MKKTTDDNGILIVFVVKGKQNNIAKCTQKNMLRTISWCIYFFIKLSIWLSEIQSMFEYSIRFYKINNSPTTFIS